MFWNLPLTTQAVFAALAGLSVLTLTIVIFKIMQFRRMGVGHHKLGETILDDWLNGRPDEAQRKAQALNIAHAYDSVEALLAHPGLQVVHNCTPNHLHAQINRQILAAGLHVFSEKPLCMTAEEARELVALAARAGVVHGVSFVYRQFAMVQQAAAMIRHGEVGRIFAAHGSYLQDWMLLETDYNWRVDAAQGGASRTVADIGSHWCDTVQFMTGRRIVEVMADLSIVWPTRKAPSTATRSATGSSPWPRRASIRASRPAATLDGSCWKAWPARWPPAVRCPVCCRRR